MLKLKWAFSTPVVMVILLLVMASLACGIPTDTQPPDQDTLSTVEALQSTVEAIESQPTASPTTEIKPSAPPPTDQPPATIAPGSTQITIQVTNNSTATVCYLFISPVKLETWGEDWLGDRILEVGQYIAFQVDPGSYDLLALACDDSIIDERHDVVVQANVNWIIEGGAEPPSAGGEVELVLVNDTSEPVCNVWIGEPYSEWITDLLGTDILPGFSSYRVMVYAGTWALQAVDCSGVVMQTVDALDIYGPTEWHINPGAQGSSNPTCGDGVCEAGESVYTCDMDCGFCGDGICTIFENGQNCPQDCGSSCGQGTCDPGEDAQTCPLDCGYCGDGYCSPDEDNATCPVDCPY